MVLEVEMVNIYDGEKTGVTVESALEDMMLKISCRQVREEKEGQAEILLGLLEENLNRMKEMQSLNILEEASFRTAKGWIKGLKWIIYKLNIWYIKGLEQQQSRFNQSVISCIVIQEELLYQMKRNK